MPISDLPLKPYEYRLEVVAPPSYIQVVDEVIPPYIVLQYDIASQLALNKISQQIQDLDTRISDLTALVESLRPVDQSNTIDREYSPELVNEIRDFFQGADEETVYPSDLTMQFGISYELALRVIQTLESEGQVEKA